MSIFNRLRPFLSGVVVVLFVVGGAILSRGGEEDAENTAAKQKPLPAPADAKQLSPKHPLWLDTKNKQVIVDGVVSLQEGPLEMFACIAGSKEHESVVAVDCKAFMIHAALLSLGAQIGGPVEFRPKYKPPSGTEVEVIVHWKDKQGKWNKTPAQHWVRNFNTKKEMTQPWVFAGSGFWTDETTGKKYYQAEGGDLICVSNFPSATLDVPIESTQANEGLLFEAYKKHIPPIGTQVRLYLKPKLKDDKSDKK